MIRTGDLQLFHLGTSRPFKCPFKGCHRSFRHISARTQHIHTRHGGNATPLPRPSTSVLINPTPSPAQAAQPTVEELSLADLNQHLSNSPLRAPYFSTPNNPTQSIYSIPATGQPGHPFETIHNINVDENYPSMSPLLTSMTSTLTNPNLTLPSSPLEYASESEPSLDMYEDQMVQSPSPLHFGSSLGSGSLRAEPSDLSSGKNTAQNIDQSSSPHAAPSLSSHHDLHPAKPGPARDCQNTKPTTRTFHSTVNGAFSVISISSITSL